MFFSGVVCVCVCLDSFLKSKERLVNSFTPGGKGKAQLHMLAEG